MNFQLSMRLVSTGFGLVLLAGGIAAAQVPKAGTSLLSNTSVAIPPSWGYYTNGTAVPENSPKAAAADTTYAYRIEDGQIVLKASTKKQTGGYTLTAYGKDEKWKDFPAGTLIHVGVKVRGNLSQPDLKGQGKPNVSLGLELLPLGERYGTQFPIYPKTETDAKGTVNGLPMLGEFDWTSLDAYFPLPANTGQIKASAALSNAVGTVEWKGLTIEVADPAAKSTLTVPERFPTLAEKEAAMLDKYTKDFASWQAELGIPAPEAIYTPKAALSGPHPRYLFAGTPLSEIKARLKRPEYAEYRAELMRQALKFAAAVPAKPATMDAEDPLREYADRPAWIALAYLVEDDPARKQLLLHAVTDYMDTYSSWGPPIRDLPLSQMIFGVGAVYDWMGDALPAPTRAKARQYLIDMARFMRSPSAPSWMWRSGTFWLANHKWFNYAALAMAAAVLWGDEAAPLQKGEQKVWMDEAMQVFWVVRKTFPSDGAPLEGYNYQDYGLRPYFDFAVLSEQLTDSKVSFLDMPGIRELGKSRLGSLLPNNAGFFTYADSSPKTFGGSLYFRLVASHFKDGPSQLLADILENGEKQKPSVAENYDDNLPDYKTVLGEQKAKTQSVAKDIVVSQAETWSVPQSGKIAAKVGAIGTALVSGNVAGTETSGTLTIAADGFYSIVAKYAVGLDTGRSLLIDGKIPFREASYIPFVPTGGWATDSNQFHLTTLGAEVPGIETPWLFYLAKGDHKLTLHNDNGGGLNFDWLALVPEGTDASAVIAKIGDTVPPALPKTEEGGGRNWRGIFWYDPSVPASKISDLPLYRDNADLGLFTARNSWSEPKATWFGYKAGPASGKGVVETFGPSLTSGHVHPDEGTFLFYVGSRAIVPGANYTHQKLTTNHSVLVIEGTGKRAAQLIGQFGEGGAWFGSHQRYVSSHPTTLWEDHQTNYHSYLSELGGAYISTEDRALKVKSYRRSITYLPIGAVVIVDRIETATPRNFQFRILTGAHDMTLNGREFPFSVGKIAARVVDFSSAEYERKVTQEIVPSYTNPGSDPPSRNVAILRAVNQTKAIFAVILAANGVEKGLNVVANDDTIAITGVPGGSINLGWKMDLQPLPTDPRPHVAPNP